MICIDQNCKLCLVSWGNLCIYVSRWSFCQMFSAESLCIGHHSGKERWWLLHLELRSISVCFWPKCVFTTWSFSSSLRFSSSLYLLFAVMFLVVMFLSRFFSSRLKVLTQRDCGGTTRLSETICSFKTHINTDQERFNFDHQSERVSSTYWVTVHVTSWNKHAFLHEQSSVIYCITRYIVILVDIRDEFAAGTKRIKAVFLQTYQGRTCFKFLQCIHDLFVQVHVQLIADADLQQDQD